MTKQQISNLIVGSLFLFSCGTLVARQPGSHNPCKVLETDLDSQVNSLHRLQDAELAQCRQTNGKNSSVCRKLKGDQGLELNRRRLYRQAQLNNCNPQEPFTLLDAGNYIDDYRHPQNEYPNKPDKPNKPQKPNGPKVAEKPPKNPSGNGSLPRTGNRGNTQSASSSANHNSGSSTTNSSSNSNTSSSGSSSSSANTSSYSPSSNPPPAPSYSPPSYSPAPAASTPSHVDTGSARPR